jgi:hypothetical protein
MTNKYGYKNHYSMKTGSKVVLCKALGEPAIDGPRERVIVNEGILLGVSQSEYLCFIQLDDGEVITHESNETYLK